MRTRVIQPVDPIINAEMGFQYQVATLVAPHTSLFPVTVIDVGRFQKLPAILVFIELLTVPTHFDLTIPPRPRNVY